MSNEDVWNLFNDIINFSLFLVACFLSFCNLIFDIPAYFVNQSKRQKLI